MNQFDSTWKILRERNFVLISEKSKDMTCVLCQDLIIKASIGPCGCRYCWECITSYLNENDKLCPGKTSECLENSLNLGSDIHSDYGLNILISRLIVKCPIKNCEVKTELRKMETHVMKCNLKCPFYEVVANMSSINNCRMENHLECEIVSQSKFLLESFDNLKNENETLKKDLFDCKNEFQLNKEDNQRIIRELEGKEQRNTLEIETLKQEMVTLNNDNKKLNKEIKKLQNNYEINKMNQKIKEIDAVLIQHRKLVNEIEQKLEFLDDSKIEYKNKMNTSYFETNNYGISNFSHKINEDPLYVETEILPMNSFEEITNGYDKFEWEIKDFSKSQNDVWFCSEPFFSHENGFKICIWVKNNISNLDVSLSFMQGEFDDNLSWPFKHGFKIELAYLTKTIMYNDDPENDGWKKPLDQTCKLISFYENIRLNSSIIKNDCLIIKCFFNFL